MRFESRCRAAIITGASSGLGASIATDLARRGLRVGLTARRVDRLEEVARQIRAAGGTVALAPADAADPDATRAALARLAAEIGPVDLLIANAGVALGGPAASFSARDFEGMVRVNLIGAAVAIESVLPTMLARGSGQVVGISSLAAFRGLPGSAGYSATKAGLTALLEGLRPQLRPRGIVVTAVHPGFVRTEMTAGSTKPQLFLMDLDRATRIIVRGIAAGRRRVDFPRPMVALLRAVQLMPGFFYDRASDRLVNGPDQ